ncbi:MAG: tyrosine-type recombinase/integrase [Phycisphaerales bacterium]
MSSSTSRRSASFRVGRVVVYQRGRVWYLRYHEQGKRHQPRVGPNKQAARQLAAQVNAQLETGVPAATSYEPLSIAELQQRWLDHHEHVRRSSVATVNRYRTATAYLLRFVDEVQPLRHAGLLSPVHAEAFVRYLRGLRVSPNGHAHTPKRALRDKGLKFILEACRALYGFAARRRHLPPYTENPFTVIEISRIPDETAKPITLLDDSHQQQMLEQADAWFGPILVTLMLTGLRPGELTHLLVEDIDLQAQVLYIRNKPALGWKTKTRNERMIPLMPAHLTMLQRHLAGRTSGPLFLRQRFGPCDLPSLIHLTSGRLREELARRAVGVDLNDRTTQARIARTLWRDMGAIRPERLRVSFMRLTCAAGATGVTAPKSLRHAFATRLQDANVDP